MVLTTQQTTSWITEKVADCDHDYRSALAHKLLACLLKVQMFSKLQCLQSRLRKLHSADVHKVNLVYAHNLAHHIMSKVCKTTLSAVFVQI